jgi:hypothetical protein
MARKGPNCPIPPGDPVAIRAASRGDFLVTSVLVVVPEKNPSSSDGSALGGEEFAFSCLGLKRVHRKQMALNIFKSDRNQIFYYFLFYSCKQVSVVEFRPLPATIYSHCRVTRRGDTY